MLTVSISLREALIALLEELDVSHAELGRRLYAIRKTGDADSWRRQVVAWVHGTAAPREASVQLICEALRVPRSRLPSAAVPSTRDRLAALESELAELRALLTGGTPEEEPPAQPEQQHSRRA